jgi:hypothetical protein
MGLLVTVYRAAGYPDCTRGGLSSTANQLCIVNADGPFTPSPVAPAAWLVKGNLTGTAKIVVADPELPSDMWPSFGGNYATSCDGRFGMAVRKIDGNGATPVAIHDRYEQYGTQ